MTERSRRLSVDGIRSGISGTAGKVRDAVSSPAKAILDSNFKQERAIRIERRHQFSVMWISFLIIVVSSSVFFVLGFLAGDGDWTVRDFFYNMGCNILAMFIVVLCLDTLVNRNRDDRLQRGEAAKILRYDRLINPEIDMYLVRKNMVITPNGRTVRKFQVDADFTVRDMRDMYGPSDLVADVGISKIKRYAHYQAVLADHFEKLIENVDFVFYPEIADAAMRYLNATSYGEAALNAVVSYEDARSGTKSMRSAVVAMIRDEPDDGRFMDANPMMKNVYLVHQMINDQEAAVSDYLRMIKTLQERDPTRRTEDVGYERPRGRSG